MFKIMAFMSRKPGLTREEFRDYYEQQHVKVVAEAAPRMRHYRRNFLIHDDKLSRSDGIEYDVVTEIEFEDRASYETWRAAFRGPSGHRVADDESKFLNTARIHVCVVEVEESY